MNKPPVIDHCSAVDDLVDRLERHRLSVSESEELAPIVWGLGEDLRLRDDPRLRRSPWNRWILQTQFVANDHVYEQLRRGSSVERSIEEILKEVDAILGRHCVICPGDARLVVRNGTVRLAASELSSKPAIEEATSLEKFVTHLPLYTLRAAAASAPAGEWGAVAREQQIDALGWMQVTIPGRKLNDRMFVAQIEGHSMDDGRSGLKNEAFAVFEFWPAGTRQNKIVLVRGTFSDPETGSYAVKKYVADERGKDNTHRRITLVSLNPDRERYPDIVLEPEQDDDVTVVAAFVAALSVDQFKRRPKSVLSAGKRDLVSEDGRSRIRDRLEKAARRVFEEASSAEDTAETDTMPQLPARFVCLDAEGGGLHIETRPLLELPTFAKKLQVVTNGHSRIVLASNVQARVCRTQVPASTHEYHWSAPGFEEELGEELGQLKLAGLESDVATLFRVDSAGIGQHSAGGTLTLGQSYRVLVPPALSEIKLPESQSSALNDAWRLWECNLPTNLSSDLRNTLEQLGLQTGKCAPSVCWVVYPPVNYSESASGDVYPSFDSGTHPILQISEVTTHVDGELSVFLLAGGELLARPLPAGTSWLLQLGKLPEGRYIIEVTHRRTRFEPVRMPFAVIGIGSMAPVDARLNVTVDGAVLSMQPERVVSWEDDFTTLGAGGLAIQIQGPPLWPCHRSWIGDTKRYCGTTSLSENGEIDLEELDSRTLEFRQRNRIGNLVLDFEELGLVELRHTRRTDPDQLRADVVRLTQEKASAVAAMSGQFPLLRNMWIHPFLERLGYRVRELDSSILEQAPPGTTAILLYEYTRSDAQVLSELKAPLLITVTTADWSTFGESSVHAFAEQLCRHLKLSEAFITDGLRWTRHRKGKRIHSQVWDLREIAVESDSAQFENFLFDFAPEV